MTSRLQKTGKETEIEKGSSTSLKCHLVSGSVPAMNPKENASADPPIDRSEKEEKQLFEKKGEYGDSRGWQSADAPMHSAHEGVVETRERGAPRARAWRIRKVKWGEKAGKARWFQKNFALALRI